MYQGTGELKNFQSSKSSSHVTNHSMFKDNQGTSQMSIIEIEIKYKCDDLVNHQQLKSSTSVMTLSIKCQSPTVITIYC